MLSKLISHEAKSMGRLLLPVFGALLSLAALARMMEAVCMSWQGAAPLWLSIPSVLLLIGAFLCAVFLVAASFWLSVLHFYRMLGEEGYLLFSVPATVFQQIWAKLLSALVWTLASLGVMVGCIWALVLQPMNMIEEIRNSMSPTWAEGWVPLYLVMLAVMMVLSILGAFLYAYMCCAVGMQFGANRLPATLIVYFGLPVVLQIVTLIAMVLVGVVLAATGVFAAMTQMSPKLLYAGFLAVLTIVMLIGNVVCYAITSYLMKNRLNLA